MPSCLICYSEDCIHTRIEKSIVLPKDFNLSAHQYNELKFDILQKEIEKENKILKR